MYIDYQYIKKSMFLNPKFIFFSIFFSKSVLLQTKPYKLYSHTLHSIKVIHEIVSLLFDKKVSGNLGWPQICYVVEDYQKLDFQSSCLHLLSRGLKGLQSFVPMPSSCSAVIKLRTRYILGKCSTNGYNTSHCSHISMKPQF